MQVSLKYILLFVLLVSNQHLIAQQINLKKEVDQVDTLIHYVRFAEGEAKIKGLLGHLNKSNISKEEEDFKLKLLLHQAFLYARERKGNKALELTLDVIDRAQEYGLPEKEYQACLMTATMYEMGELAICKSYLDRAYQLHKANGLENVYSIYCIRLSSYYRLIKKNELAIQYARTGIAYALKYGNKREYIDGCLLLGLLLANDNFKESVKYSSLAATAFLKKNDYEAAAQMYNNIVNKYLARNELKQALQYSDTVLQIFRQSSFPESSSFLEARYNVFDRLGNQDSAYYYLQKFHNTTVKELTKKEAFEIKKITEQYQGAKKEALINTKNQQIVFVIGLLIVIASATVLIIRKNRKISSQNKIISKQLEELVKTIEQKQVLLSELQHRVKNNLQHLISILEIQKESIDFNNIDEVIQGNQNRIHSMALLHKMLDISETVNEVDLNRYITELAQLVKDSYATQQKKITLEVTCDIQTIAIEKALPIGLIVVELVSNSMKHAFKKQHLGAIRVNITKNENKHQLYYADNGSGHDFNQTNTKGLGMEIIKGLIDQLNGSVESHAHAGFELKVRFK